MDTGTDGEVPRFRDRYTYRQCEARGKLRAFHWSEAEIDTLLGEPDAFAPRGGPAYGADRAILGAMSLESSWSWPWPSLVPYWKDTLTAPDDDTDEAEGLGGEILPDWGEDVDVVEGLGGGVVVDCGPPAVAIKPSGFGWMGLCQRHDAIAGDDLVLYTRSGPRLKTIRRVHAEWGDYALVYMLNSTTGTTLW